MSDTPLYQSGFMYDIYVCVWVVGRVRGGKGVRLCNGVNRRRVEKEVKK